MHFKFFKRIDQTADTAIYIILLIAIVATFNIISIGGSMNCEVSSEFS